MKLGELLSQNILCVRHEKWPANCYATIELGDDGRPSRDCWLYNYRKPRDVVGFLILEENLNQEGYSEYLGEKEYTLSFMRNFTEKMLKERFKDSQ
jgi:hypothetical protein